MTKYLPWLQNLSQMAVKSLKNTHQQSLTVPKWLILTGKTLQALSSDLAARFAAKMFITPIAYPVPLREENMMKMASSKPFPLKAFKETVTVYEYGKSPKKALLVHGWSGRGTQLFKIADALLAAGYMTISFDAPAHGQSPGKQTMMPHFIAACHELADAYGGFDVAIGHSLGGMSLLNAVKDGLSLRKLVVIGTGDSITEITLEFVRELGMKERVAHKMKAYFDRNHHGDLDELSASRAAKEVKVPTLVIHDTDDRDVKVHCAYRIAENLKNHQLYITEKLGHRKILGNPGVIQKIINFIA